MNAPFALPDHPVIIIGAGPVGLAAAAKCVRLGLDFLVLEAGEAAAWTVRQWSHVRLFSPWDECLDGDAAQLLKRTGWRQPSRSTYPTGGDLVDRYLQPLSRLAPISSRLRFGARVASCTRRGMGKTTAVGRFQSPFSLTLEDGETILARAILDCSGIWSNPRQLPVSGYDHNFHRLFFGVPNLADPGIAKSLSGASKLVVGAGHSAMTAIVQLAETGLIGKGQELIWVRHGARRPPDHPNGSARKSLEMRAHELAHDAGARLIDEFWASRIDCRDDRLSVIGCIGTGAPVSVSADAAIISTGFRPDHRLADELWLAIDHRWEAPRGLAELIDPDLHSCGQTPIAALEDLAHPEANYFVLGAKSFGRAPNFALTVAYDHLDVVLAHLAGVPKALQTQPDCATKARCCPP